MFKRSMGSRGRGSGFSPRRFSFQRLEDRTLLAVTTSLANGDLTITGDTAADDIAIVGTANPGELTITGRNGTVVNGTPGGSVTVPGVARHLIINLNGGDDHVSLDNTFIAGNIEITTGDGDDRVVTGEFSPVSPAGHLSIRTGAGNDVVLEGIAVYNTFVVGMNFIVTEDGSDFISLYGTSVISDLAIFGGTGADNILLNGVTGANVIRIDGGSGANSIAALYSSVTGNMSFSASFFTSNFPEPGPNVFYVDTVFCDILDLNPGGGLTNDPGGPQRATITVRSSIVYAMSVGTEGKSNTLIVELSGNTNVGSFHRDTGTPFPSEIFAGGSAESYWVIQYNRFSIRAFFVEGQHSFVVTGNVGDYGRFEGGQGPSYLGLSGNLFGELTVNNFIQ
jgi:hypothetical protein